MKEQDVEVPKGRYAAGRRVRLPRGAEPPIRVHINGVEQREGTVFEVRGNEIVFARPIVKETVTPGRWMAMYLGLFGTYRKHEAVDVEYRLGGLDLFALDRQARAAGTDFLLLPGGEGSAGAVAV